MRRIATGWLRITAGLFIFAFGLHLTIKASIGVAPWDTVFLGIASKTPLTYGLAAMLTNVFILAADIAMGESIGFGTFIDAVVTGLFVDLIDASGVVPDIQSVPAGALVLILGLFIMAVGQYFYMTAGQGCGPKDSFVVGVGKRMPRVPIGAVQIGIQAAVLILGFVLGGPIGLGTLLSVVFMGTTMQIVFRILRFEPRDVRQENVLETIGRMRHA